MLLSHGYARGLPSLAGAVGSLRALRASNRPLNMIGRSAGKLGETGETGAAAPKAGRAPFCFLDYDCIGFDLDNSLCLYNVEASVELVHGLLADFLVEQRGYAAAHLRQPIGRHCDLLRKGLFLDLLRGNVLHLEADGRIARAVHGTRPMSAAEVRQCYGADGHWPVADDYVRSPLHFWNGPAADQVRPLLDYFDMPAGLVFARAVDAVDEASGRQANYAVWPDVLDGLVAIYRRENFALGQGYFRDVKERPEAYVRPCSDRLKQWLRDLRGHGKALFLITGSSVDFAAFTAERCMGPDWRDLFDLVVCFAKKPGFFTAERPFCDVDGVVEGASVPVKEMRVGSTYMQGNFRDLESFFQLQAGRPDLRFLYVGDNLIQDVYAPAQSAPCDTVAIVEELQAEVAARAGEAGEAGEAVEAHPSARMLLSDFWGSYFATERAPTFWESILNKYARVRFPSLEHVALHPVGHVYAGSACTPSV